MSDLATAFQPAFDLTAKLAEVPPAVLRHMTAVAPDETVAFGPDPRLAIGTHGTLLLDFLPGWLPWSDAASTDPLPTLVQLGTASTPGACFALSVSRELDALHLSSPSTPDVTFKLDWHAGGRLALAFGDGMVHLQATDAGKQPLLDVTHAFRAGDTKGLPGVLTLGSDSANLGTAPFSGLIGNLALFDRNVLASINHAGLVNDLFHYRLDDFFAGLGLAQHQDTASALVGVKLRRTDDGRPGFDFNPRRLFWPTADSLDTWTLRNSTGMPVQVDVPGVPRSAHGIYSSFCVYCVVRIDGEPWLHGDAGQRLRLRYLGGDRFHAETAADHLRADGSRGALAATLTLESPDKLRLDPGPGWTNLQEKLFPWAVSPAGTTPRGEDGAPMPDAVRWPAGALVFERTPAHYDLLRGQAEPVKQSQIYKDSFSTRLKQLGMSFRGWNLRAMDSPLNLAQCTGGQRDETMYLFQQPADDSRNYRLEGLIGAPYFCFVCAPEVTDGGQSKRIYRSADEYSHEESTSYGANLAKGDTSLVKASFEKSDGYSANSEAEHTIAISHHTTMRDVVVLDKRWLELAPHFVAEVRDAAGRLLRGEGDASLFDELFRAFGTHYPHAVTYGCRDYTLSVLDEDGLGDVASHGTNLSLALDAPIGKGLTLGGEFNQTKTDERGHRATFSDETEFSKSVGTHEQPGPVLIDLRPLTEILQPPYLVDEPVRQALPQLQAALDRYLAAGRSGSRSEGLTLVQARLVSIRNLDAHNPRFVCGRAFLAGVAAGEAWRVVEPASDKRRQSAALRVWASAQDINAASAAADPAGGVVRIEPGATYTPDPLRWGRCAVIGLPRNDAGIECAIGWTGHSVLVSHQAARLATQVERDVDFSAWAPGAAPSTMKVDAPPEVIAGYERGLANAPPIDFFGQEWVHFNALCNPTTPGNDAPNGLYFNDGGSREVFREGLRLSGLSEGATFDLRKLHSAGLEVTFAVRKIDPLDLFENAASYKL